MVPLKLLSGFKSLHCVHILRYRGAPENVGGFAGRFIAQSGTLRHKNFQHSTTTRFRSGVRGSVRTPGIAVMILGCGRRQTVHRFRKPFTLNGTWRADPCASQQRVESNGKVLRFMTVYSRTEVHPCQVTVSVPGYSQLPAIIGNIGKPL